MTRSPRRADTGDFEFIGFVEGGDIPGDRVDVIVTDGFTGNIALKTGEGTAKLISDFLQGGVQRHLPVQDRGAACADLAQAACRSASTPGG